MKSVTAGENATPPDDWASYYDTRGVLDEILDEEVEMSLAEGLRDAVLNGKRRHKLQSVTLKLDPIQVQAIRKLATMKSIPYQTLIRHWLSEDLKRELHLSTG